MGELRARELAEKGMGEALSRHGRGPSEISKAVALADHAVGALFAHQQWLTTFAHDASQEEYVQRTRLAAQALFDLLRVCLEADEPDPRDELILALYRDRMLAETSRSAGDTGPRKCATADVFNALYELLDDPNRNREFKKVVEVAAQRRSQTIISSNTDRRESSGGATSRVKLRLGLAGTSNIGPSRGRPDNSAIQRPSPGDHEVQMNPEQFLAPALRTGHKDPAKDVQKTASLEARLAAYVTQRALTFGSMECRAWNRVHVVFGRGLEFFSIDAAVESIGEDYPHSEALENALYNVTTKAIDEKVRQLGWGK